MKTRCFDAIVEIPIPLDRQPDQYKIEIKEHRGSAIVQMYPVDLTETATGFFAQIHITQMLDLYWGDRFELKNLSGKGICGKGLVLDPNAKKTTHSKVAKKVSYLLGLSSDEKSMLYTLVQQKGIKGLSLSEMKRFTALSEHDLTESAQALEAEGKIKILAFAPLFLLAESSIEFLCESIMAYITKQQQDNPEWIGVPAEQIDNRFHPHPRVLLLALKHLERSQQIKWVEGRIVPADFNLSITPEDEELLEKMETLVFEGKFQTLSIRDLKKQFRLSSEKLDHLLAHLLERNKVIQAKDGFLMHAKWLEELIAKLQTLKHKEFSVSEFKTMTGLSRKYAIPLLEWLDQQGITRRKGSVREIL